MENKRKALKMKREYKNIEELIKENLSTEEHGPTQNLINELKDVFHKGYFTKEELLKIGSWKTVSTITNQPGGRSRPHLLKNSEDKVIEISKRVFSTNYEKRRMELLTQLKGVNIPTASAILMLTDPKNYGVIDIRVWQVLYLYGSVKVKPTGRNLNFNNWYNYLMKIRYFADQFKVKARDIERTFFSYHPKIQEGRLYD